MSKEQKPISSRLAKDDKANPFYGKTKVEGQRAICLNCKLTGGLQRAFGYSYISQFNYNPSIGIEISTTEVDIIIHGRNLQRLYLDLLRHKVTWIQAADDDTNTPEEQLCILEIEIKD